MVNMKLDWAENAGDLAQVDWRLEAKNILKSELRREGVTYAVLADRLAAIGVEETEPNLKNKISRGGFSFVFFLQCMAVVQPAPNLGGMFTYQVRV